MYRFTLLGYVQCFVSVMAFLVDPLLSAHYLAAFILSYLLLEQPNVTGNSPAVENWTPVVLKERARASEGPFAGVSYLVFLHAPYSLQCNHIFGTFSELAARYATEKVVFARLDLSGTL